MSITNQTASPSIQTIDLLGKIMAQVISILALSTKFMSERRISELIALLCLFLTDYRTERFLKRLIGRTDIEDALCG